jgi:hypothetical protein
MSALALIRPHDWTIPLFLHILGAMVLVGALTLSAVSLIAAWRSNSAPLTRLGLMSVFYGAIPGWIIMRGGAQWIQHKEHLTGDNSDVTWLNIGITASDMGFVLLIALLVIGGLAVRRMNRQGGVPVLGPRVATVIVSLLLVAYLVTVWAMTVKPT